MIILALSHLILGEEKKVRPRKSSSGCRAVKLNPHFQLCTQWPHIPHPNKRVTFQREPQSLAGRGDRSWGWASTALAPMEAAWTVTSLRVIGKIVLGLCPPPCPRHIINQHRASNPVIHEDACKSGYEDFRVWRGTFQASLPTLFMRLDPEPREGTGTEQTSGILCNL